jgi:polysaccharide export outer membrane protein
VSFFLGSISRIFAYLCVSVFVLTAWTVAAEQVSPIERIHVGDVIEVDQIGGTEFDWRGSIGADGSLNGFDSYDEPIYALCKTEKELATEIENSFRRILREPKFQVRIIDRSQRPTVVIDGAVKTPTRFRVLREVRLRELIALAGGLTDSVAGDIIVNRQNLIACAKAGDDSLQTGFEQFRIRLKDLVDGQDDANIEILTGDNVVVEKAAIVYIIGGVINPGSVFIRENETVMSSIEKAGGFVKDAVRTDIAIFRRGENGSETMQCGVVKGAECDPEKMTVRPFDIIEVGAKGRAKRQYAPVIAAVEQAANGSNREMPLRIIE